MSVIRGRGSAAARANVSTFEDLEVFQRAYRISLDLHRASLQFPKIEQYAGLADQIRRASKSICGNIAEGLRQAATVGCGVQTLSSDSEWIGRRDAGLEEVLCRSGIYRSDSERLRDEYRQIARMLQGLYTSWRSSDH